jgi:large subunit ribosomal protein L28
MSRECPITGKKPSTGNNRSHSMRATKRIYRPNLVTKRLTDPTTGKKIKIKVSTSGLRTLTKKGLI